MQSDLEREMSRQLSLMQHKAVDPWPSFVSELRFTWCCEHPLKAHGKWVAPSGRWRFCSTCKWLCEQVGERRNWRADFCFPEQRLLVEVDGGNWLPGGGRHGRGVGAENDARKQARAVELGFRVLRFTGAQVKSGEALNSIGACLGMKGS